MSKINRLPVRRTAAGVLAGALALSGAVATALPANAAATFDLQRISGEGRYETSAAIARAFVAANTGAVTNVILASGESTNTPDALAASFLAGVRNAPVVLTQRATTPAATRDVLAALRTQGATTLTVVGGAAAVTEEQVTALRALGWTVTRVGGANRYETAALIATAGEAGGTNGAASNVGLLASGVSTIDALAGGPVAFKGRHPLFLTTRDGIPAATLRSMQANGVTSVYILGGENAVSARVVTQLRAANITVVDRLGGADRSATSVAIARAVIGGTFGFTNTTFNVASGINGGVDALGGAALSGKQNRVLLVTNTANSAAPIEAFARENVANLTAVGNVFGGPTVVSDALVARIEAAAGASAGPVALTSATVAQGGNLTGTITGDFSSVTFTGCGFTTPQTVGADDNATTAGRQFTIAVPPGQAVGNCDVTFTFTPTGGGATTTQVVRVNVTARQAGATATARPELTSAAIVSTTPANMATTTTPAGTVVRYTFDERVASVGTNTLFNIYNFSAPNTPINPDTVTLDTADASGRTVLARFNSLVSNVANAANTTADISVATVTAGAVTDTQGLPSPTGDAPLGTGQQGNATLAAGRTTAPDLVSLGGFRGTADANVTAVDFTFDQAAFVQNAAGFELVLTDGRTVTGTGPATTSTNTTAPGGGTTAGGNGTTTITVLFTDPPAQAAAGGNPALPAVELSTTGGAAPITVARGTVFSGTVGSLATGTPATGTGTAGTGDAANTTAPSAAGQQVNPLQSSDTPKNNTVAPDLVSVTFNRGAANTNAQDVAVFTFDQPVSSTTGAGTLFRVYTNTGQELLGGTGTPAAPTVGPGASNNQVAVSFVNGALVNAVGGNVLDAAVTGTAAGAGTNQQDEVAAANIQQPNQTAQPAGRTTGPDLTSVTLSATGTFNQFAATYTFDEQVTVATAGAAAGGFNLYLADGTRLLCDAADAAVGTTSTTNNQVTCDSFTVFGGSTAATNAQVGAATAGTAVRAAVVDLQTNNNVEGYEVTTGGTGTAGQ